MSITIIIVIISIMIIVLTIITVDPVLSSTVLNGLHY